MNKVAFVEIGENHAGQRLDNYLFTHLKGVPKSHIYRIIRKGEVRINKGRVKQTTRLQLGDVLRIPPIRLAERDGITEQAGRYGFLLQHILFEDNGLLILNKPSGMAVHAGSGVRVGIIEALRAIRSDLDYIELVHRLDRDTSGCLVLAKKTSVLRALNADFSNNSSKNKRLDKRYLTLVKGRWRGGERRIEKPLNTDKRVKGERHVVVDKNGSFASSIMRPVSVSDFASLLEVSLLTGRTHQVRVHALSENHPVAGDKRYGDLEFNKSSGASGLRRLFLHASQISLMHPISNKKVTFKAQLPDELLAVLSKLNLSVPQ